MGNTRTLAAGFCFAAGLSIAATVPATAQDTVALKLSDRFPDDHYVARYSSEHFIDEVEAASGGKVSIQRFGSQQLGKSKDALTLLRAGVFDIGELVPSYMSDQLSLTTVAELPGIVGSACEGALAYERLAEEGGIIHDEELGPANLKVLYVVGLPPYQIFSSQEISDVDSLSGLKIRSSGGGMDAALRGVGMVPIRMSAAELYESFARGTVDGTSFPVASILSYDLGKFSKYGTRGESFGSNINIYAVTRDTWDALSPEMQEIMEKAGKETTRHACELIDSEADEAFAALQEGGTTLVRFDDSQKEKLDGLMSPAAEEWAKNLDDKGRSGSKTLAAFRQAVKDVRAEQQTQ